MDPFTDPESTPIEQMAKDIATIRYYVGIITAIIALSLVGGLFLWVATLDG